MNTYKTFEEAKAITGLSDEQLLNKVGDNQMYAYDAVNGIIDVEIMFYMEGDYVHHSSIVTNYNGRTYSIGSHKEVLHISAKDMQRYPYDITRKANEISHGLNNVKKPNLAKLTALLNEAEEQIIFAERAYKDQQDKSKTVLAFFDANYKEIGLERSEYNTDTVYRGNVGILRIYIKVHKDGSISMDNSGMLNISTHTTEGVMQLIDFLKKIK